MSNAILVQPLTSNVAFVARLATMRPPQQRVALVAELARVRAQVRLYDGEPFALTQGQVRVATLKQLRAWLDRSRRQAYFFFLTNLICASCDKPNELCDCVEADATTTPCSTTGCDNTAGEETVPNLNGARFPVCDHCYDLWESADIDMTPLDSIMHACQECGAAFQVTKGYTEPTAQPDDEPIYCSVACAVAM